MQKCVNSKQMQSVNCGFTVGLSEQHSILSRFIRRIFHPEYSDLMLHTFDKCCTNLQIPDLQGFYSESSFDKLDNNIDSRG